MFDVSFTEMLVIAVVALVVIGPERLPKVARTIGHLLGRAQRYVSDVKGDIRREMELDELRTLRSEMEDAARSIKSTVDTNVDLMRKEFDSASTEIKDLAKEAEQSGIPLGAATPADPAVAAAAPEVQTSVPVVSADPVSLPAGAPQVSPDPVVTSVHPQPAQPAPVVATPSTASVTAVAHAPDAPAEPVLSEPEVDLRQASLFPSDVLPPRVAAPADTSPAADAVVRDSEKT